MGSEAAGLPLSTLLSQVLVAFTIEFDNEFEHQMPHRTTNHGATAGSRQGPWLVSLAMWSNCMRFVSEKGMTVGELEVLACSRTNLNGMARWGYIVVEMESSDKRSKLARSAWVVRATPKGMQAREIWRPLFGVIEERWQARFGKDAIGGLRESLGPVIRQFEFELPDCLPILGYGLFSRLPDHPLRRSPTAGESDISSQLPLAALLSRVLLAFAVWFERKSNLSLAISANVVRVLDEQGVRVRDLPLVTGVSKESISMALGVLRTRGLAEIVADPGGGRSRVVRLTPKGREAQDSYRQRIGYVEERWRARFGEETIRTLRDRLEPLIGNLFGGLEPYPDGWRASVRKPKTLPHYPMVLHRGGYPDGS